MHILPSEYVMRDDEPIRAGSYYIVDKIVVEARFDGTVHLFKHSLGAREVRFFDGIARKQARLGSNRTAPS